MRFGDLTYQEIHNRAVAGWLVVLPTGCTEQQGPHLPVDFDTWFVETVCLAAAETCAVQGAQVLVLPAFPFGPTPEHRNFGGGYIDLPQELHEAVVMAALNSVAAQGFRRIVIWRGCGQHNLRRIVDDFNRTHYLHARAIQPDLPYAEIMQKFAPGIAGGHADSFCTSIALHLRPESVQLDKIPKADLRSVDWGKPELDFSDFSFSGVIGDPTLATAELGSVLWQASVAAVARIFRDFARIELSAMAEANSITDKP
jgi:creatinine amidohydrolase